MRAYGPIVLKKMMNILEEGDIEEALNAANSIGDDRLQKQAGGRSCTRCVYSRYVCTADVLV